MLGIVHWRCDGLDDRSRIVDGRRGVRLVHGRCGIVQRSGVRVANGRGGMVVVGGQRHGRMSVCGSMAVGVRSVGCATQIAGRHGGEQQRQNVLDGRSEGGSDEVGRGRKRVTNTAENRRSIHTDFALTKLNMLDAVLGFVSVCMLWVKPG